MNKTVSINLGGSVFNIEEDAFVMLKNYLDRIKQNFLNDDAQIEIMHDIEMRIAELFAERMNERKNVIVYSDVQEVVTIMGRPEDYKLNDDDEKKSSQGSTEFGNTKRRIFRDKDDAIAGGVCAGLSHYFGWDPLIPRLIVVFIFLISGGTAILGYILFWALVPAAETTAEKLRMRGEPVNVENISRFVNEEAKMAGERINKWGKKTAATGRRHSNEVINVLGRVLSIIFGAILLCFGLGLLIFLFVALVASDMSLFGFDGASWEMLNTLIFDNDGTLWILLVGFCLLVGAPAIAFLYAGLRLLVNTGKRIKGLSISLFSLFIIGIILCTWGGISTGKQFTREAVSKNSVEIVAIAGDTLHLETMEDLIFTGRNDRHNNFGDLLKIDSNYTYLGEPLHLEVRNGEPGVYKLEIRKSSHGRSLNQANELSSHIQYDYKVSGDTITLAPHFTIPKGDRFRGQCVDLIVYVPKGNYVSYGKNMNLITWYDDERTTKKMGSDGFIDDDDYDDNESDGEQIDENAKVLITEDSVIIKGKNIDFKTKRNR